MTSFLEAFHQIWLIDFEYRQAPGGLPEPVCMAAKELRSGKFIRCWEDKLHQLRQAPYSITEKSLSVAYYASAEFGCFLALGWPLPINVIDLYAEFRCQTNGLNPPNGNGLLGALAWYGIDSISAIEKENNRDLILRGSYTSQKRTKIMKYCESDVLSLEKLFKAMVPSLPKHALLRGNYMKSVSIMERNGVPIDLPLFNKLRDRWKHIQNVLVKEIDKNYGIYNGNTFKYDRFVDWLRHQEISWPVLPSGRLVLDESTFKDMAKIHPEIEPIRQLRWVLSQMRLSELTIGPDGRNRCLLSPYKSITSRNQPSTSKFIFGPAVWLRGLIKPECGTAIAYIDYEQEEFGIAAALSEDPFMVQAYLSGDPYLEFAKMSSAVPQNATKQSHPRERELFKQTCLGLNYGMGAESLAVRLGITKFEARELIRRHKTVFKKFWSWVDAAVEYARLNNELFTIFGWRYHITGKINPRSLQNFPMQGNGAEVLRLVCSLATEHRIKVCAPIHDAILIEAPESDIEDVVKTAQAIMREVSEIVLNRFSLRSEAKIIRYPDRYMDERGILMWNIISKALGEENGTMS